MNGWSYTSLQNPALKAVFDVLRPGFTSPTIYKLTLHRENLKQAIMEQISLRVASAKFVCLAFDGWTSHRHTGILAIAIVTASQGTLVVGFKEVGRETAEVCRKPPR